IGTGRTGETGSAPLPRHANQAFDEKRKLVMKKKIARLLPGRVKQTIKARLDRVNVAVIRFFALNGFLSSVYYAFFSRQFQREHRAVLLGRLQYWASLAEIGESCVLLRRNIHRLEKGLIMRPRRERFA